MKSIIIVIPYFGEFPSYFKFWLHSAYNNPTVDFLLITDCELESKKNVKAIKIKFEEFAELIKSKFDFNVCIEKPYKLCDYKACYGYLFPEYINEYDFWGFGDIDLIYGDIRSFFTKKVLEKYYVISGWGHLTLYKNNNYCNEFFKVKTEGFQYYKEVLSRNKGLAYCEFNHMGLSDHWRYLHPDKIWDSRLFDDIRVPSLSFNFISEFHNKHSKNLIFEYENKNLYRIYTNLSGNIIREKTLYVHFQQRGFMKILTNNTNNYFIVPSKFIDIEQITIRKLEQWTKPRNIKRIIWNFKNRLKRRFGLILNYFTKI